MHHMNSLDLAIENLTSLPVLAFVLGALAVILRSDLRLWLDSLQREENLADLPRLELQRTPQPPPVN